MVKMKLYNSFNIKKNHKNSIILIGNFDGLHLGHQKLFRLAKKYKKKYSSKIGVLMLLLRNLIVNFQKQNQFHLLKKL